MGPRLQKALTSTALGPRTLARRQEWKDGLCGVRRAPRAAPLVVGGVWSVAPEQGGSTLVRSCRGSCGLASASPSALTGTGDTPVLGRGRARAGHRFARAQ